MRKLIFMLFTFCMLLTVPMTVKAEDFREVPMSSCKSYNDITSLQLSGVTNNMLSVVQTITNEDTSGKDYFFRMRVPKTSMTNLFIRYKSELRWNYSVTVYNDATCTNIVYKDDQHDFGKFNNIVLYLPAGDYYVKLHNTYDAKAVLDTFPPKEIDKQTTNASGSAVTIKVPNPAKYESSDNNIFYTKNIISNREYFTVNNTLDIGMSYAPVAGMVTTHTSYKNNVCTLVFDAGNLLSTTDENDSLFVQFRKSKTKGQSSYNDPSIWNVDYTTWTALLEELNKTDSVPNSTDTTSDFINSVSKIGYIPPYAVSADGKITMYIDKSGWYSFRIALLNQFGNPVSVIKRLYIDVTSPTVRGVTNGKIYTTDKTVKFEDDAKGVGILKATYNGKTFPYGKKFKTDGKYIIRVYDNNKNVKKVTFYIDKKKPVVTGVKNNKTYLEPVKIKYSDAGSGIKSATLNGVKIKSGYKVTKNGNYVLKVTDKVGRTTTVSFKVRLAKVVLKNGYNRNTGAEFR